MGPMALLVNRIGEVACFIGHDDPGGRCKSWLLWFAHETTMTMTMMGDGDGDDGHGRLACLIRVLAKHILLASHPAASAVYLWIIAGICTGGRKTGGKRRGAAAAASPLDAVGLRDAQERGR